MVAHLVELHIELCRLFQGHVDFLDLADLAANMVMHEFQTVLHVVFIKEVEGFEELRGGKAELAAVTARFFPLARAGAGQFDAHAEVGGHFQSAGDFGGGFQLIEFLDDDDDFAAHLLGK